VKRPKPSFELRDGDLDLAVLFDRVLERALRFRVFESWVTRDRSLDDVIRLLDGEVLYSSHQRDREVVVLDLLGAVVMLLLETHSDATPIAYVHVHAASRSTATLELAHIKELLPAAEMPASNQIKIGFWYRTQQCARVVHRTVEAVAWSDARHNYPAAASESLEESMKDVTQVFARGRLMLWHGPPGTGKTSALRTLALENRGTLSIEYVLDPEVLFGRDAAYFVDVLFKNAEDEDEDDAVAASRVLVLEDCDELLSADAKERAGQGLARLLNLVDGLIGQGMKLNVLITTNEPLGDFHPAVSRPGRCGAAIAFGLLQQGGGGRLARASRARWARPGQRVARRAAWGRRGTPNSASHSSQAGFRDHKTLAGRSSATDRDRLRSRLPPQRLIARQDIAGTLGSSSMAASIRDCESSTSSSLPAKYASYADMSKCPWPESPNRITRLSPASFAAAASSTTARSACADSGAGRIPSHRANRTASAKTSFCL